MFITHMLMRIPEPSLFPTVVKPTPVPTLPPTPTPPPTIPPAWAGERLRPRLYSVFTYETYILLVNILKLNEVFW